MEILNIETIRSHLRIDPGMTAEDAVLDLYGNSAETAMAEILNRGHTAQELVTSLTEQYGEVPPSIRHALLIMVDHSYQHRSAISAQQMSIIPYSLDFIIKPYMKL